MTTTDKPTKTLVLLIEVPDVWADDLPESAETLAGLDEREVEPDDYLFVVTEEWMQDRVSVSIVTIPGDKSGEDAEIHAYVGTIVGAEVRDRKGDLG